MSPPNQFLTDGERLTQVISEVPGIQLGGYVEGLEKELFRESQRRKGWRGLWLSAKTACINPGSGPPIGWKIKARLQQEFVVGGWKNLGALLVGAYRNGKVHYFGHSGSGFTEKGIQDALKRMKPLFIEKSPFENPPRVPEKIQWVKAKLVCEVAFAEWTDDEQMRKRSFSAGEMIKLLRRSSKKPQYQN
jgi:bifunctional non-homologous end joining protein LigD